MTAATKTKPKTKRSDRTWRPGSCSVCSHAAKAEIEIAAIRGVSMPALAKTYGISGDSIWRHMRPIEKGGHVTAARRAELAFREVVPLVTRQEKSIAEMLEIVRNGMFELYLTAKASGDFDTAAAASGRLNDNIITAARVLDGMKASSGLTINNTTINFASSPAYLKLIDLVLEELRDLPEVRARIVRRMRGLNDAAPARPNGAHAMPVTIEGEIADVD